MSSKETGDSTENVIHIAETQAGKKATQDWGSAQPVQPPLESWHEAGGEEQKPKAVKKRAKPTPKKLVEPENPPFNKQGVLAIFLEAGNWTPLSREEGHVVKGELDEQRRKQIIPLKKPRSKKPNVG